MKLKKIQINNYRQFESATLDFEEDITIIAGANNSGKTSIVELLNNIFSRSTFVCKKNDIPVMLSQSWIDNSYDEIITILRENEGAEDIPTLVTRLLFGDETNNPKINIMDVPTIFIEVEYQEGESIVLFSDYLMELDLDCRSFYFKLQFDLIIQKFSENVKSHYSEMMMRILAIDNEKDEVKKNYLITRFKDVFIDLYIDSLEEQFYFANKDFSNLEKIDSKKFRQLFYFKHISAVRNLDDESDDKNKSVTTGILSNIQDEDEWKSMKEKLPEKMANLFDDARMKEIVKDISANLLNQIIEEISKTNGGHNEKIELDVDITNAAISSFINNVTCAKYVFDTYHLNENTQGLGYSNLIYIHLELENYLKRQQDLDDSIVRIFIIEEAEAHMHPQMQRVFIKYLFEHYNTKDIQGLLTTHSNQIVQVTELNKLRVLRQVETFISKLYDINLFIQEIETKPVGQIALKDFYEQLFSINFSDIVFSDKVIIYEGETERMYIESLIKHNGFKNIADKYISYIQSGGAYAHIYEEILNYLELKTLIITDIDYNKDCSTEEQILNSETTNATIKHFYKKEMDIENEDIKISGILEWQEKYMTLDRNDLFYIAIQGREDKYSRTLEEAMLSKLFNLNIDYPIPQNNLNFCRKEMGLRFTIPQEGTQHTIREIVEHTSNKKTDFMYSVIINNWRIEMLPNYIKEGLKWLQK